MGNRAVITTGSKNIALYLHWNGGRASVEAFLQAGKELGYRCPSENSYGWLRLGALVGSFFPDGLSCGLGTYDSMNGAADGDNYTYIIKGWEIVRHEVPNSYKEEINPEKTEYIKNIVIDNMKLVNSASKIMQIDAEDQYPCSYERDKIIKEYRECSDQVARHAAEIWQEVKPQERLEKKERIQLVVTDSRTRQENNYNYKYLVRCNGLCGTGFNTLEGLKRWASKTGLTLPELPESDTIFTYHFKGEYYYENCILYGQLPEGKEVEKLTNGNYCRATITQHQDGHNIINYHNPNEPDHLVKYDYQTAKKAEDSENSVEI